MKPIYGKDNEDTRPRVRLNDVKSIFNIRKCHPIFNKGAFPFSNECYIYIATSSGIDSLQRTYHRARHVTSTTFWTFL